MSYIRFLGMKRMLQYRPTVRFYRRLHLTLTIVWVLLIIPSVLWWRSSLPWLVFMSVWANIAGHFSAWQGTRAEGANDAPTE